MARKQGQIIARAQSTWLVRIYQERDPQTATREYLNQTIHGPPREVQRFLNLKLQQREKLGALCAAAIISSTATIATASFNVFRPLQEMKVPSYAIA